MSFSTDVRNELARIIPEKECCRRAELSALLVGRGELAPRAEGAALIVGAENPATVRKIFKLLRQQYDWQPAVEQLEGRRFNRTRTYALHCELDEPQLALLEALTPLNPQRELKRQVNNKLLGRQCCRRAYVRGMFLSHGFVNRPEGEYHLELIVEDNRMAVDLQKLLLSMGVAMRRSERKGQLILYLKDGEQIVDFLRIVDASNALLEFENVRIIKSMRNQVNRQVNCENANLDKTINAAVRQVDLIKQLLEERGFQWLPIPLREVAALRMDNPDATLRELGQMMTPPLSKGGIAYRMRRLEKLVEQELQIIEDEQPR